MNILLLFFLLLLAGTGTAQAALYNLQDTARPGLATSDGQSPLLRWWEGGPAYVLASSGAVRLNFRALYTYPPGAVMRGDLLDDAGWWHSVPCNASAWAFCSSDVGQIMPWLAPRMPELQETVTADGWNDLGCANSAGKVLVSLGVYDVSACDIFDEGLDLLYTPGMIYHRHNTLQTWKYWVLVTLAIVLVRFLSYNIQVFLLSLFPHAPIETLILLLADRSSGSRTTTTAKKKSNGRPWRARRARSSWSCSMATPCS